jgi:hypothetical protein
MEVGQRRHFHEIGNGAWPRKGSQGRNMGDQPGAIFTCCLLPVPRSIVLLLGVENGSNVKEVHCLYLTSVLCCLYLTVPIPLVPKGFYHIRNTSINRSQNPVPRHSSLSSTLYTWEHYMMTTLERRDGNGDGLSVGVRDGHANLLDTGLLRRRGSIASKLKRGLAIRS